MKQTTKLVIFISVVGCLSLAFALGYDVLRTHYAHVRYAQLVTVTQQTTTATPIPPRGNRKVPTEITIPALHVKAPIQPVGLDRAGHMATLANPTTIAWYVYGAAPGAAGNAILAGHRDWNGTLGTFWNLEQLQVSDDVVITFADGTRLALQVVSDNTYPENAVPADVMRNTGETRTTLITCAGDFVRSAGGYQSRVVIVLQAQMQ